MPNWAAWLGWAATLVFGVISLIQFIQGIIEKRVHQHDAGHLEALGNHLAMLRQMCTEAIEKGEVVKSDSSKQFVRQIGWSLLTAERHVQALLDGVKPPPSLITRVVSYLKPSS